MANVDLPALKPDRVRQLLSDWFASRATAEVAFIEDTDPEPIPYLFQETVYEAVFEPSSLDKARVEIWVTVDGSLSIGLEQKKRVARRLGVRGPDYESLFAAECGSGIKPVRMNEPGLMALLDTIADGRISIAATTFPIFGLISTKALTLHESWVALVSNGYDCSVKWLKVLRLNEFPSKRSVLTYRPW